MNSLVTSTISFIFISIYFVFIVYRLYCSNDDQALNKLEIVHLDWSTRDELKTDEQFGMFQLLSSWDHSILDIHSTTVC